MKFMQILLAPLVALIVPTKKVALRVGLFFLGLFGLGAAAQAQVTDPIAAVTTTFTTLTGNATTLGIALIGVVAAIAVILLAIAFLRKGHH